MATVNVSGFRDAVMELLDKYVEGCTEVVTATVKETAKEGAAKLRRPPSPINPKGKKSGAYAKNWTHQAEEGRLSVNAVIYGKKPTYRLAHLLEHGHALRQGGRSPAIEHIKPVEDWAEEEAVKRIRRKIEETQ